jgi:chemotaxis protein CheZ
LVNKTGVSIHHAVKPVRLFPTAFIFDERAALMVNCRYAGCHSRPGTIFAREPVVKLIGLHQRIDCELGDPMPVRRKRFRIEEISYGSTPMPNEVDNADVGPMHREIMTELRAIRDQMGRAPGDGAPDGVSAAVSREIVAAQALLETYRAQIAQCEKLKVELDLIHDAISRTKREIAVLHGKSFNGDEMSKVTGELGAVVGGTEEATQQILEAAEAIDQASSAMMKVNSPDQQKLLSEEIQERVVSIFEACNFQDLTGQRIGKVMNTMKFIENHINVMMDIWGGVDAIRAHAPPIIDDREGDARLLNGPKTDGDVGHASQNDIDALFD